MDIVEKVFDYYSRFSGEKGYIGLTENNLPIPYINIKKSENPKVIVVYSIHAREYITSYLALKQIDDFLSMAKCGNVFFIPMLNIDGVKICLNGKSLYKANYRRVDLNVNFDAGFGLGKYNIKTKSDANFIGEYPFSERESRALRDFTNKVEPHITLSYHSKGEEIYWYFFQKEKKRDYAIAKALSKSTGYKLKTLYDSYGGYKDWCIEKLHIPSFTIEVGSDNLSHPIGEKEVENIYNKNREVIKIVTESKWKNL